jgi:hypothetical protein
VRKTRFPKGFVLHLLLTAWGGEQLGNNVLHRMFTATGAFGFAPGLIPLSSSAPCRPPANFPSTSSSQSSSRH